MKTENSAVWIRFLYNNKVEFGTRAGDKIQIHEGLLFENAQATGETCRVSDIEILTPCEPEKMIGLWNNYYNRAEKEGWEIPPEPLYFIKPVSSFLAHGQNIRRPKNYDGTIYFEAELGLVIGKRCSCVSEENADEYIFGYTCVNDVTALEILGRDKSFAQWARAKSPDTFGVFGPSITTGIDPLTLTVKSVLDGEVKQESEASDMIFKPQQLVSLISQEMTLMPGDVIACGTDVGSGPMINGQTIQIEISGLDVLSNTMLG